MKNFEEICKTLDNGGFASVSSNETNALQVYKSLKNLGYDCHCFAANDIAVFTVMDGKKFISFLGKLNALRCDKHVIIEYDDVSKFVEFANACGLNVMGGAFLEQGQVLYID